MKPKEIAFVCYGVKDLKVARAFYENVLGLTPENVWEKDGMGMIEYGMGTHTLAIGSGVPEFQPGLNGGVAAIEVEDYEAALKTLKDNNVVFTLESMESPVCFMAAFKDLDGNQLMIHKRKGE